MDLIWPTCSPGPMPAKISDRREPNALDERRPGHFRGLCGELGTALAGYRFTDGALDRVAVERMNERRKRVA